jgi:hypothetical protein
MSQSRWLIPPKNSDDIQTLFLKEAYVKESLASSADIKKSHISCFEKCSNPSDNFKYNKDCMRSCINISNSYFSNNNLN